MNRLFVAQPTSVFERMSGLARTHEAVNLGQGFPDFGWPSSLLEEAARAVREESNQYPPMRGLPELREALADHYRRRQFLDVSAGDVTVTSGATEALAASLLAMIEPGDEVVLFQPLYDAYLPMVLRAGGVPRLVNLEPPGWRLTAAALDSVLSDRTRIILLNNPHNPTGRCFERSELDVIADACRRTDALLLTDEVWEHLLFDGRDHVPVAGLPGMAERTVKVGSAGKIFSLTGWKVGWIVAPPPLGDVIARAHQFLTFTTPPNLQRAVAFGLGAAMSEVEATRQKFGEARDYLRAGLEAAGLVALPAQSTYFMNLDLAASGIALEDDEFCTRAAAEAGVAAIPLSALYAEAPARNVVRLCFAKTRETLDSGIEALGRAKRLFG